MLTNIKDNFIDAYFIDEDRQNIEILQKSDDGKKVIPTIIAFEKPDDTGKTSTGNMEILKEVMSVDELHERTYQKKKEERKLFEEQVMRIAKKDGMMFDENKLDTKFYPTLVNAILKDQKNEDHLFALKLALFENETINGSDNAELKAEIRKGTSKIEVMQSALKFFSEK
tara:strand:+ start:1596 stop:2105 length:510 start_codon:yes stop_codon:yes gene_type:complete